jgi:hypothetical protein
MEKETLPKKDIIPKEKTNLENDSSKEHSEINQEARHHKHDFFLWFLFVLVLGVIVLFALNPSLVDKFKFNNVNTNSNNNSQDIIKEYNNYQGDTHECNQVYLGMCLDEENKFYGCNLIDEECNVEDLMLVKRIKYLEDNNIQIYGSSQCPYCNKEYEEFGKYGLSVKERGLFFFCDLTPVDGCKDVESVPAWKQNGTIIHVGYQPLSIFDSYIK